MIIIAAAVALLPVERGLFSSSSLPSRSIITNFPSWRLNGKSKVHKTRTEREPSEWEREKQLKFAKEEVRHKKRESDCGGGGAGDGGFHFYGHEVEMVKVWKKKISNLLFPSHFICRLPPLINFALADPQSRMLKGTWSVYKNTHRTILGSRSSMGMIVFFLGMKISRKLTFQLRLPSFPSSCSCCRSA